MAVNKEIVNFYTKMGEFPEGIEICMSWQARPTGAFCVWTAKSKEDLEKLFGKHAPTLKSGTEIAPTVQSHPPTMEFVLSLFKIKQAIS